MMEPSSAQINPYVVSGVVSLAAFIELLDTTIANVALSHIAGSLGAGTEESTWVLTAYIISNAIVMPISGWLSGVMGRKNFFMLCIGGFVFTSFMCGIATSLPMLVLFRLLQGVAGGGLQPVQQAIIRDSFPPEKLGIAFGITGLSMVLAPIIGPTLGGFITDNYSWRWIFLINVPIGIVTMFLVKVLVQGPENTKKVKGTIDYIGLGLIAIGLGALQIVLDKGQQEDWFDSTFIITLACISFISLLLAVYWLLRQKDPIVDLKLLAIPSFSLPGIILFFVGFTLWSATSLLPMMVQEDFGYNATLSGLVLSPSAIFPLFMMPFVGKLVNWIEARYLMSLGLFINAIGMWLTGLVTPQTDYATFAIARCFQTAGLPFLFVPATTLAFSRIPREKSSNASAIVSLLRNLGGSIGISLATSILVHNRQMEQSNLVQHLTIASDGYSSLLSAYTRTMQNIGLPAAEASAKAMGQIYQQLLHQASVLAYRDTFNSVAAMLFVLGITALFLPGKNRYTKNNREDA
ncbi:DHA2 family efflux MFS transporter permease subunit [Propionispora vibrioides]|uniref:MFS transporter, DHA2 family, multidrug resistance protein n=1 Tax=Propionispora vibrioides TaxID=112903 RepID=A0A1H8XNU8_9FIRM|nr:DHA2 family efflux MFS transporter permease subunit [Propionispora vibrioides]SEP41451.1 MFS transporter, DHA2 family, multidrug resistance protein [Propionispora vibrioides]